MAICRSLSIMQGPTFLAVQPVSGPSQVPGPSAALFAAPYYSLSGTQYYVNASTGNDSFNGLSPTILSGTVGPWATLAHAASVNVGAGSVINVAPGTYTSGPGTITHGGNAANSSGYVVWRSQTLGGAIITDPGTPFN